MFYMVSHTTEELRNNITILVRAIQHHGSIIIIYKLHLLTVPSILGTS